MKKTTNFCIQFSVYDKYAIIIFVYNYNKFPFVYINTYINKVLNFLFLYRPLYWQYKKINDTSISLAISLKRIIYRFNGYELKMFRMLHLNKYCIVDLNRYNNPKSSKMLVLSILK